MDKLSFYVLVAGMLMAIAFMIHRHEAHTHRYNQTNRNNTNRNNISIDIHQVILRRLHNSEHPILWVHVDREYNSRNWSSFGSRSSFEVNQPYMYFCVRSIIRHCSDSFTICLIDDNSFAKMLPGWNHDMTRIPEPSKSRMRSMGICSLLYEYGGLVVPSSFVCLKDLYPLYARTNLGGGGAIVIGEKASGCGESTELGYCTDMGFIGAHRGNETMKRLIEHIDETITTDLTAQPAFDGYISNFLSQEHVINVNVVQARLLGRETIDNKPILLEQLLGNNNIEFADNMFGIWVPGNEILTRTKYSWYARLSEKQVLESNVTLSKYILVSVAPSIKGNQRKEHYQGNRRSNTIKAQPDWVGFWTVPLDAPVYGLKPVYLGQHVLRAN